MDHMRTVGEAVGSSQLSLTASVRATFCAHSAQTDLRTPNLNTFCVARVCNCCQTVFNQRKSPVPLFQINRSDFCVAVFLSP